MEHILEIADFVTSLDSGDSDDSPQAIAFSDSIVRVTPLDVYDIRREIEAVGIIQGMLAGSGIFVRGGITVGDVFISKNRVFGPAIIDAYELESTFANYPRVIVSPTCDRASIEYGLQTAEDGMEFVDYAPLYCTSQFADDDNMLEFLFSEKEHIETNLRTFSGVNRIFMKYSWLANYHNRFVDDVADEFLDRTKVERNRLLIKNTGAS